MPRISVVIPTVTGREQSLARCLDAFRTRSSGAELQLLVVKDKPTCGLAWLDAMRRADAPYVHLSADDHEPHDGWWQPLVEAMDAGFVACPLVLNPDGSVQSAGGDLKSNAHLIREIADDWSEVPFAPVPSLTRELWDRVGMIETHYFTDVWVSARAAALGVATVLRVDSVITHHNERVGRAYGMSQGNRDQHDALVFRQRLEEAA